jgi:hypothetical protein
MQRPAGSILMGPAGFLLPPGEGLPKKPTEIRQKSAFTAL